MRSNTTGLVIIRFVDPKRASVVSGFGSLHTNEYKTKHTHNCKGEAWRLWDMPNFFIEIIKGECLSPLGPVVDSKLLRFDDKAPDVLRCNLSCGSNNMSLEYLFSPSLNFHFLSTS